jgi:hypothetical protein
VFGSVEWARGLSSGEMRRAAGKEKLCPRRLTSSGPQIINKSSTKICTNNYQYRQRSSFH